VRLVAPLSTSTVTSTTPTLRWVLPAGADGAEIDLCHDRACTSVVTSFTSAGTSARVPVTLAAGVYFWRASAMASGRVTGEPGMVWELFVPARGTPVDTSWGSVPDFNGDGYADVLVLTGLNEVYFFFGGPTGPPETPSTMLPGRSLAPPGELASAGDVNGDGFADVLVGAAVFLGGPSGPATTAIELGPPPYAYTVAAAGDVNGDGYADLVGMGFNATGSIVLLPGGPKGPSGSTQQQVLAPAGPSTYFAAVASAGDFNGDGFGDFVVSEFSNLEAGPPAGLDVFLGSPTGAQAPGMLPVGLAPFVLSEDVNGDGYCDLVLPGEDPGTVTEAFGDQVDPGAHRVTLTFLPSSAASEPWVSCAGDVNGDGYGDVVVAGAMKGVMLDAYVFPGGASGLSSTPMLTLQDTETYEFSQPGHVAGAGDVNGDGRADLLFAIESQAGQVDLFFGTTSSVENGPSEVLDVANDPELASLP
jgi:hypothetical protein